MVCLSETYYCDIDKGDANGEAPPPKACGGERLTGLDRMQTDQLNVKACLYDLHT